MKTHTQMHEPELPFGHPGHNFDESPAGYSEFDDRYEPQPEDPPKEDIVHYAPGDRPLCGAESWFAAYTDDPTQVRGCQDCQELVQEDLNDNSDYAGRCMHCRERITTQGGVAWRQVVRSPCPHCGTDGW